MNNRKFTAAFIAVWITAWLAGLGAMIFIVWAIIQLIDILRTAVS